MPKHAYITRRFSNQSLETIALANLIIAEYAAQGFDLTLRQLYYQFVSRAYIPNNESEYKKLGSIINDARLAGMVDWNAIKDRTRTLRKLSSWRDPEDILETVAIQFHLDLWEGQEYRPEVWIEKDALLGVIQPVCDSLDVPYFSCHGYNSQSEMWIAGQRLLKYKGHPVILHLGDHDPSGIDMTRDTVDRLELFTGGNFELERLALNQNQIARYNPPPNPTKLSDSRSGTYLTTYGGQCWELDALEPTVLANLIRDAILRFRDDTIYEEVLAQEEQHKKMLAAVAQRWVEVAEFIGDPDGPRTCFYCKAEITDDLLLAPCRGCHKFFCGEHIVPDWHDCTNPPNDEDEELTEDYEP